MNILFLIIFILLAIGGTGVVFIHHPLPQSIVAGIYGMLLTILFLMLQAPDVALSEVVVGSLLVPLMTLLALAKTEGKGSE
jgi:uncharacterized MnhB-related membrane protein